MSIYKKFADLCSMIAVFMAFMHLIRRFIPYDPSFEEPVGFTEKVKSFFDKPNSTYPDDLTF